MLRQLAPRLTSHARQLLRPSLLGALPRNPVFFSTTARRFNYSASGSAGQSSGRTSADTVLEPTKETESESEPETILTNQDVTPSSVSFTVNPPSTLAFFKPTPVVLLTGPFGGNWCFRDTWQATLADQGYQSTSIELSMPSVPLITGDDYIQYFATTLKTSIETDHSFYPPILIAHGLHALVAQKYVESNPVSALVLVSPFIPELIKDRFQELSHQLLLDMEVPEGSSVSESEVNKASAIVVEEAHGSTIVDLDLEVDLTEFYFETHADILAQEGFKERYILPKKAVYKIDQIAKELQEKGRKEMKEKETHSRRERDKDAANQEKEAVPGDASVTTGTEALGKDSVPVWEVTVGEGEGGGGGAIALEINTSQDTNDDTLPEQTVESEASIPSPLEKLPLNIYDTMAESIFEPHFPILLVTSNGDELVSTDDVKLHHDLAGLVDHIELEDLDDGGHLIMVSDNTEWEQGIQGITAWLDSNGM